MYYAMCKKKETHKVFMVF